jgi:hypothetical protein
MRILKRTNVPALLFPIVLGAAIVLSGAACKTNEPAGTPAPGKPGVQAEAINLTTVSEVLGKATAENSGVFDLTKGDTEYWLDYHFYTPEAKDIDDDIGMDLAPKIQALYKKYKTLDRIQFIIIVFHTGSSVEWTPYCSFVMTRKVINETDWAKLLAPNFFQAVLELKYVE